MSELVHASALLVVLLASSAIGLFVRPLFGERLGNREVIEVVQLAVTKLVTFAALVLSLLITSAKASIDALDNDMRGYAARTKQEI